MSLFEAYNSNGSLQFNAETYAYRLIGSGSITALDTFRLDSGSDPHDPASGVYLGTYSWPDDVPTVPTGTELLAFQPDNCFGNMWFAGGKIYFRTQPASYSFPGSGIGSGRVPKTGETEHTGQWYAYQSFKLTTPPSSGVGLQLINWDGTLAWDSSIAPLLVTGSYDYTSSNAGAAATIPGSHTAVVMPLSYQTLRSGVYKMFGVNAAGQIGEFAFDDSGTSTTSAAPTDPITCLGVT